MSKRFKCIHCGGNIASSAKTCPSCGEKNKKSLHKRWYFILSVLIIVIGGLIYILIR